VIDFLKYKKAYGRHEVLSIPDLSIPNGIHWIKGINGSGKSTILKSIAGIIPFKGHINIEGHSLKTAPVISRRLVAYSEAEPLFPDFLTAKEILDFVTHALKVNSQDVDSMINYFEMDSFMGQATGGYSAGMLKKLSLCLAFLGHSSWILLDEPLAFIDKETENKLIELIQRRHEEGSSIIITSHHELDKMVLNFDHEYRIDGINLKREV